MYIVELKNGESKKIAFHSIAAIYKIYSKEDIGCKYENIRNRGISHEKPFENKKCIIRKVDGVVIDDILHQKVK